MTRAPHLAVLALAIGVACLSGLAGETKTEAPFTWSNPITCQGKTAKDEIRDPCIIAEGGKYYLVFTVWPFRGRDEKHLADPDQGSSPGIKLFSSLDLKTWTFEKWLVKSSELPADCPYKHRFWAPEIHKIGGKFYLIFTADNWLAKAHNPAGTWGAAGYAFVGVADKVTGPYERLTYIPGAACDTTLFGDTDGRTYAFMPFGDMFVQEIDLRALTSPSAVPPPSWRQERGHPAPGLAGGTPATPASGTLAVHQSGGPSGAPSPSIRWLGERRKILTARNDDIGFDCHPDYLEGPWVIRRGDRYVLFYAAPYRAPNRPDRQGYWTGVAYADHPLGPWKKDPRGPIFLGGHVTTFPGPAGRDWFAYRGEQHPQTRGFLCIDPFEFDPAGAIRCTGPSTGEQSLPIPARR